MPAVNQIHPPASPRRSSSPRACAVEHIAPGYAAIDIGAEHLFVASAHAPVRRYRTFTSEVRALCAWLRGQGVSKVAMEATGVYWMPLYEALQNAGLEATLFNGAHARNLPGRKSDAGLRVARDAAQPRAFKRVFRDPGGDPAAAHLRAAAPGAGQPGGRVRAAHAACA